MADKEKSNHEKINYSLRPAKHVERKMLCDAFLKLSVIDSLDSYQYIGFGSAYFSDFSMIHKVLGVKELISIERDEDSESRFRFNIPYSCIDLKMGESGKILPKISWKKKAIIWLDYTEKLSNYMLDDIQTCILSADVGSVFLLSINIEPDSGEFGSTDRQNGINTPGQKRLESLKKRLDTKYLPDIPENSLLGLLDNQKIVHEIISNAILGTLKKRNGILSADKKIEYKQIFNFYYKDGAGMLTIGGLLYNQSQKDKVEKMAFENLFYTRDNNEPFKIIVPQLTFREIHALDNLLPKLIDKHGNIKKTKKNLKFIPPVSDETIRQYANIYRYFPSFHDINI